MRWLLSCLLEQRKVLEKGKQSYCDKALSSCHELVSKRRRG